ncbi:DUF3014 domain-containing protein [Pseudohongiella sp.]|uniref:DUF3014 domain-containing protein n=1 Tax=marine sediment metagenome TaxID=412755 RepID=A0A0F9W7G8_9ZZZZ|nr:DUF3014 domain-containing protein [Pseudohongiella sp.]HDZ09427.1 DUF3014 domain-containing protein [Pseudohongiella sp.]HEA63318.1 DUF3014 domain-containing protein [Pseudohongiella sp.]
MAHKTLAIIAVLSLIGVLFLVYLGMTFEPPEATRTVEIERPVPRPVTPVTTPAPVDPVDAEPIAVQEVEPVPEPAVSEPEPEQPDVEPLPPLNDSDSAVIARLASVEMGASLLRLLTPDDIIRKFVVFTYNASQGELPQVDYPLRGVEGDLVVTEIDTNLYQMQPATHRRFDTLIDTLVALEPGQAMSVYRALRPLFQEAYAELGLGSENFDEVLVRAIDQVMAADTASGPFQLIKPSVMYLYAEGRIEDMSPVEKQLLRLGPENTEKLKGRLPAYRERLQAGL